MRYQTTRKARAFEPSITSASWLNTANRMQRQPLGSLVVRTGCLGALRTFVSVDGHRVHLEPVDWENVNRFDAFGVPDVEVIVGNERQGYSFNFERCAVNMVHIAQ
jgi:hypothetical protein